MQAHEFGLLGLKSKMKVAALLFQITDAKSVGLANLQGLFTSKAFYWDRNEASRAFGKRFVDKVGRMPTMALDQGFMGDTNWHPYCSHESNQTNIRVRMAPVCATWKERLGGECWNLLEGHVGKLG